MRILTPTITPNKKQHQAWGKLKDETTEFVVFGGAAGGGKSWLGCEWLLTSSFFYPGTKYFIGREGLGDIKESTLITFYKVLSYHGIKAGSLFKYNGQDHYLQFHNGSRIDLVELKHYPSDPMFERLGSMEFTSGWIEEGGEIHDGAAAMISSRTGRVMNDKYGLLGKTLITCNPKKNFLYYDYYKPWKDGKLPGNKAFIQSFVDDNDKGETGYKQKLENLTGVAKQRLLFGNWEYDEDPATLIDYEKIIDCFSNTHVNGTGGFITADIARFGADKTVIGVWTGHRVRLYGFSGLSISESASKIQDFRQRFGVGLSSVIVDEDGVGGGVVDILKCKGFVNNSTPLPNPGVPRTDEKGHIKPENYDNLKSQCYFRLADRINSGGLYIQCEPEVKETIIEELEQVKQKDVDSDKKKGVMPKDKVKEVLGRSPDYSDTLMMREVFDLQPQFKVLAG